MLRGWERTINKSLLYAVLPYVEVQKEEVMVFALPSFLSRKGFERDSKMCLVLIIKSQVIVTAYWCQCIKRKINRKTNQKIEILY